MGAHSRVYVKRFLEIMFSLVALCISTVLLASFPGPHPASRRLQYGKAMGSWVRAWERGFCTVTLPPLSSSDDDEGEASHSHGHPSPSHTFTTNHSTSSREDLEDETVSVQVQGRAQGVGECHLELILVKVSVSCYI